MATMVKEKPKRKKTKEKNSARSSLPDLEPCTSIGSAPIEAKDGQTQVTENDPENSEKDVPEDTSVVVCEASAQISRFESIDINFSVTQSTSSEKAVLPEATENKSTIPTTRTVPEDISNQGFVEKGTFKRLNELLERMSIPAHSVDIDESRMMELENPNAYLQSDNQLKQESSNLPELISLETVAPSAPVFEEASESHAPLEEEVFHYEKPKVYCMSLDEAIRLYGGKEMAEVRSMSEREEAEVEAGPNCGPEHPLVDLLSTFRSSLRAVEHERSRVASNFDDEEKFRSTLWKIEKKKLNLKEQCKCGLDVHMSATYEHAQLLKERLPIAKLKLEGLLRDVQESYCHHQHAALLAHCQVEDIISEIITGNKPAIREALSLVLQALRVSDGAEALPAALQRWAEILAGALVDARDLRQLLFVIHHLFRQTRSVRWAARALQVRVQDSVSAARTLALLDTLLSKLQLEAAVECNEDTEEAWEEVDIRGGGGAVSSGTLRERDLIALLRALPLQQLIAKIVLFSHADFKQATEYEWGDASGGNGLLKACCGVRVLLSVLQRAGDAHPVYQRLHRVLRELACSAMTSLACLYQTPRAPYYKELEEKIEVELEAIFSAGFTLFGTHDLHKLPTTLLTEDNAKDYCNNFIVGLHDKSSKRIESLNIEAPALPCGARVRILAEAVVQLRQNNELARTVLEFLLKTGLKHKSVLCKTGCEATARECVPLLLTAHPYLRCLALHRVADLSQVETLDPSTVNVLQVDKWRPSVEEIQAVLHDWSKRCPALLQQLLLQLNYTPHVGVSHPVQLSIGSWLCSYSRGSPANLEKSWRILLCLRTHIVCWQGGYAAPPDITPTDAFSMAYAVLANDWGDSIPLICSVGVNALVSVCASRPREAVHCLAPVILLMSHSPESVSLTPKFAELFTTLLNCGPNLMQRALGRGGASGYELLLRLVLSQVGMKQQPILVVWLHALWKVPAALGILDIAALASRDWFAIDTYAASLLREENSKEHLNNAVRCAPSAPLLCECLLRAAHAQEVGSLLFPALVTALCQQRAANQRIHVDNALQKINANITSEELIIYKCANAALVAPFHHPSHLTLWRLFIHMFLQRPPDLYHNGAPPGGPLFFSGLIKSRILSQIKKRLQETATHHHKEAESYKQESNNSSQPPNNQTESIIIDNCLLPALTITDLTGELRSESESDTESEGKGSQSVPIDGSTTIEAEKKRNSNMAAYHAGAEKMMREYLRWLEEGENVAEVPAHADIARFIHEQALEEAWKTALSSSRPPPSDELDTFLQPAPAPPNAADHSQTPLRTAIQSIDSIKCRSMRSRRMIRPRTDKMDDADLGNVRLLLSRVEELLKEIEKYAQEWGTEVSRISSLDSRLWELVSALRVPRPLPPVRKQCSSKCKPITFHLNTHEWCISAGAERGIRESRSASLAGIRRLTRARPKVARTAAALHTIARRIRSVDHAVKVLELAWRYAGHCPPCNNAHTALTALFDELAQRWITHNGRLCHELLSKSCANNSSKLQHALCGSLVAPRRLPANDWPLVYTTLLKANLPSDTVFSYLSRFEMHRWASSADPTQRQSLLTALLSACQRSTHPILTEIIGVHSAILIKQTELCWILLESARISTAGFLPPVYWMHLNQAAEGCARELVFDDIGNLLRELGSIWWRVSYEDCQRHATYAPYIAELLCILMRAFVAATVKLTYEPVRGGWYAWLAISESWAPWVFPHSILPHPGVTGHYTTMLEQLTGCVRQVMIDCPGSETRLLQEMYAWAICTYRKVQALVPRPRVQMSSLLEHLAELPWQDHQWYNLSSATATLGVIFNEDEELSLWCCDRFRGTKTETFLSHDLQDADINLPMALSHLLRLFTGNLYVNDPELLKEAAMLPWWHLTEESLIEALDEFFSTHNDPAQAYHDKPQAIVILNAGELQVHPQYSPSVRHKRQRVVTQWTSASSLPALRPHRAAFTRYMQRLITSLDPYLEKPDETEDLLCRVSYLTQWETQDNSTVVTAWQQWICSTAPSYMLPHAVSVASKITIVEHASPIADDALRMHLQYCEGGWAAILHLWQSAVFKAETYAERSLYAAYACICKPTCKPSETRPLLAVLQARTEAGSIDFLKNETIIALWICYALRVALACDATSATEATATSYLDVPSESEMEECRHAAVSLLASWGQQARRSILKVVTLQADNDRSTARHRVLVRLAQCILSPSPSNTQAFESACASLPAVGDVTTWPRAPTNRKLVRLASRLFSSSERYFQWEMDHTPAE